jgi:hemerythrin-like metal-binding protein
VLLVWRDDFKTGIASVDYEHKQLIDMINAILQKLGVDQPEAVNDVLAALHDRIAAHFALEERVMQERRYDGYAEHKADHERLLDEIRDLMEQHRAGGFRAEAELLAERLDRWFSRHFGTLDVRLHRAIGDGHS